MICCYLLHCRSKSLAQEALDFYGDKRTFDRKVRKDIFLKMRYFLSKKMVVLVFAFISKDFCYQKCLANSAYIQKLPGICCTLNTLLSLQILALEDQECDLFFQGVTIPSQRRYVDYYAKLVNSNFNYNPPYVRLREAVMNAPLSSVNSGKYILFYVLFILYIFCLQHLSKVKEVFLSIPHGILPNPESS